MLHLEELVHDFQVRGNVLQDAMLGVHHHVLTRVDYRLDPHIALRGHLPQLVVAVRSLQPMVAVQDVQRIHSHEELLQIDLAPADPPQRVLPAVDCAPAREGLLLVGESLDQHVKGRLLTMADDYWPHVLFDVGLVVEVGPMEGLLVSFDAVLMVILGRNGGTWRLISARRPREV